MTKTASMELRTDRQTETEYGKGTICDSCKLKERNTELLEALKCLKHAHCAQCNLSSYHCPCGHIKVANKAIKKAEGKL